jgi:iron complex transport system ATP-binding protein
MLAAQDLSVAGRLSRLTAALRPGEVTAICGPNGAGKSTLLNCLAGLLPANSGAVTLDGQNISSVSPQIRARSIGYLPQSPEIAWDVSVEVLVSLGRIPWAGTGADDAINAALTAMDLNDLRDRPTSTLSGGERARALMARVLAGQPNWLLADEPLANLDLAHSAALIARLREQARHGRGVVLVLHDLAQAMNHADRVLVLHQGQLVADGAPAEALSESNIAAVWGVTAQWLGDIGQKALCVSSLAYMSDCNDTL